MEKPLGERHTILSERGAKNGTDVEEFANADCHAEPCAVLRAEPHADKFAEECAEVARGSGREKGNVR